MGDSRSIRKCRPRNVAAPAKARKSEPKATTLQQRMSSRYSQTLVVVERGRWREVEVMDVGCGRVSWSRRDENERGVERATAWRGSGGMWGSGRLRSG